MGSNLSQVNTANEDISVISVYCSELTLLELPYKGQDLISSQTNLYLVQENMPH
jgi:hypothetical protein